MKKRKKKTRIIVTGVLAGFVLFFLAVNIYFMQCAEKENERKNVLEEEKEKLVLQIQDLEAEKKDMEKQQVQAAEQKENQEEQKEELPGEQKSSQGLDGISGVISN